MRTHHPVIASWVRHVADDQEKDAIIKALLDCTPACALQSAISSDLIRHDNAIKAYRAKYSIKNMSLTIDDFAQEESDFCRKMDI